MEVLPPLALHTALLVYFYYLLSTYMNCYYRNVNELRQGQQFTNLACLSSLVCLSLLSLSHNLLSLTSLTSLHTMLAIFNMPCVINMLQTVRFPITVVHGTLTTYPKLEWLVNRILSFSQSTYAIHVTYAD